MFEKLQELGLNINDKTEILEKFMHLFLEYNQKINLISRKETELLFEKHIYDSLAFNLFYSKYCNGNIKLLDIGTGGGFPSIPIAIFYNNIDVWALDSKFKKIQFIEFITNELGLKNIHPICARIEELPLKQEFDICISRAVSQLRVILEYAVPYLKEGAFFAAYKSLKANEEINAAKNALKILNSEIYDRINYTLPLKEQNSRTLIIIKKKSAVPNIYPRQNGIISKKPL